MSVIRASLHSLLRNRNQCIKNVTRLFGLFLSVKNHFRLLRLLVSNFFGRKRVSGQSDKLVICIKNIFTVQTRRQPTPMPFCRVDFPRFPITRRFSCCCTNRTRFGSLHYMAATTSYYVMLLFAICIKSGSCRFDRGEYPFWGKYCYFSIFNQFYNLAETRIPGQMKYVPKHILSYLNAKHYLPQQITKRESVSLLNS